MGVVFEAEHMRLRQPVAIKLLSPELFGVEQIVERFDREARAAATLRSRHVVRVTDVEQTPEGLPYIVMELLEGTDLESERTRRGRLPWGEAVDYVLQACGALAEAHDAGIIHRDLKPANLFLAKEDDGCVVVKILDFGISKFTKDEDSKITTDGAVMGTALYMSPEQVRGASTIDARSDIWALGVILYELIAGQTPWSGAVPYVAACVVSEPAPDIRELCPVPEPLAEAIHRMLEKDPSLRPATIVDVAEELAPYAPPGSVGADVAERLMRRSNRSLASSSSPSLPDAPASRSSARHAASASVVGQEPSTMDATSATVDTRMDRPRVRGGALAGFGVIGVGAAVLLFFVARAREPRAGDASAATEGPVSTMQPAASASAPHAEAPPASAHPPEAPAASSAPATSASTMPVAARSAPPAPRRPRPARPSATSEARAPAKPAEPTAGENPLFLK